MALLATRYVTVEEARLHVGLEALKGDQEKILKAAIADASAEVESRTGTWWDKRKVQVTTSAIEDLQQRLFMPAPIISIASITVDGTLVPAAEYIVHQSWIESASGSTWTRLQRGIVVVGFLGVTNTPGEIKRAVKELAGAYSGLKTKTYVAVDGVQNTVNTTAIATWVDDILDTHARENIVGQRFEVVQAAP